MRLIYGVWEQAAIGVKAGNSGPNFDEDFAEFDSGDPILALVGDKGFGIFSDKADLASVLLRHHEALAAASCGRCTPCRTGSRLLVDALRKACEGKGAEVDWQSVRAVALQMRESSLCGVGRTGVVPLLGAIEHFADKLATTAPAGGVGGSYTVTTAPCVEACPSQVDVPRYVDAVRDHRPERAAQTVMEHYPLVGSCGRVCVRPCESACTRCGVDAGVSIRALKRHAADHWPVEAKGGVTPPEGVAEVAVVGGGPAGYACAYHLLLAGHSVDILDATAAPGGMIRYGIPSYRLPKSLVDSECDVVTRLGGRFRQEALGPDLSLADLEARGYKAIFIGIGASMGQLLHLPEDKNPPAGYENGIEFLRRVHDGVASGDLPRMHGDVVVVGGGNVAMDCCRSATRLTDGKVHVLYRRTEEDLPADREEIEDAIREGVQFHFLSGPAGIVAENGQLTAVKVQKMERGEPDASGRRSVTPIEGSEEDLPCRHLIAAIGQKVRSADIPESDNVKLGKNGVIVVDGHFATSRPGVYAGGDCVSGPDTLINAMSQGERAAHAIIARLEGKSDFSPRRRMSELLKKGGLMGTWQDWEAPFPRKLVQAIPVEARKGFDEVEHGILADEAIDEANRCLRCYRVFTVLTASPVPSV